jgi:hypothetical protein
MNRILLRPLRNLQVSIALDLDLAYPVRAIRRIQLANATE